MKHLSIYLFIILFTLQTPSWADDIRDFQIEGMSVGDSALDYLSKEKILKSFKRTKDDYIWLKEPLKFREAYIHNNPNFKTYTKISFMVKPNDKNYTIFSIRGIKTYNNKIDLCLKKRNEIASEIESIIPKFKKRESNFKSHLDKSGKSYNKQIVYTFKSGDEIIIGCSDWEEELRKKNNWLEGISVFIGKKELIDWFKNKK